MIRRNRHWLLFLVIGLLSFSSGRLIDAKDDYWVRECNSSWDCGYVDKAGNWKIPAGKYSTCYTDTFRKCAIVLDTFLHDFIAIDRQQNVLFHVRGFDNGPDPISEGVFRIRKDTLEGFGNMNGEIVIEPKYRFVQPFSDSLAAFSLQGHIEWDKYHEHSTWAGALWGYMDHWGNVVLPPKYDRTYGFRNGETAVMIGTEWMIINKKGEKIRDGQY